MKSSQKDITELLQPYQLEVLDLLLEGKDALTAQEIWIKVNQKQHPNTTPRANIINFLQTLYQQGILITLQETGPNPTTRYVCLHTQETLLQKLNQT